MLLSAVQRAGLHEFAGRPPFLACGWRVSGLLSTLVYFLPPAPSLAIALDGKSCHSRAPPGILKASSHPLGNSERDRSHVAAAVRWICHCVDVNCRERTRGPAADLTKIERLIVREPAYESDSPRYCLLVLGPEAATRVWLVWDGESLYVDRDADGDLTKAGEKVAAEKDESGGRYINFKAGDIAEGERLHKGLSLSVGGLETQAKSDATAREVLQQDPAARSYFLSMDVAFPGRTGIGLGGHVEQRISQYDTAGYLQFSQQPADAPIIHFGGPLTIEPYSSITLRPGREQEAYLGIGTRGLGPGTMAWVGYEKLVPEDVFPTIEITYPPFSADSPPLRETYELKHRC